MDPSAPPTTAHNPAATFAVLGQPQHQHHQNHHHHHQSISAADGTYATYTTYNKKDAYLPPSDPREQRGSKGSNRSKASNRTNDRSHDSVISHPFSPKASSPPSPTSSISSTGRKHRSITEVQQAHDAHISYPPQAHLDPEKARGSPRDQRSPHRVSSNPDVVLYDSSEYHEKGPEEKPVQLLLFLSLPCALLSFAIMLWTIVCLFAALFLQPFRLCTKRPSLSSQLTSFLAPPLNLQLHLVYSFSSSTNYSVPMMIIVHLLSPVVAIGVAIGAWTAAFFWFFSAILGDPAGQDGHNDGKESLLGVRNWWDRWLSRGLR